MIEKKDKKAPTDCIVIYNTDTENDYETIIY